MEEYEKNFGSKKAAELWENFLTQVGVKGGKKFLLFMNLLVGKGKAGRIHFFMKLILLYTSGSWHPFTVKEEQTQFLEIQSRR